MERVVGTWFSDNGKHPANQSGIAATCATRGIASGVYVVTGACSGPCPASSCTLGWLTSHSGWKPFWTELIEASTAYVTNVYTADARTAAGASANDVHQIYNVQNSANVADHVATTCSISSLFVHDAHYYYVVM